MILCFQHLGLIGHPKNVTCPPFWVRPNCENHVSNFARAPRATRQHESKADCLARSQRARQPGPARQPGHFRAPLDFLRDRPDRLPSATHLRRRVGTQTAASKKPPAASASWPVRHLASLVALLVASISISIDCEPRRPFSLPPIILFCHVDVGSWACPGE